MGRFLAALIVIFSGGQASAGCKPDSVDVRGPFGQVSFQIELADTPKARSRGLMFRENMPRGAGMLFVYDKPQRATFWMKNTLIPLDMIFADQSGTVTHVHTNAIPHDTTLIDGGRGVFAVLEINAGLSESYGILPGAELRHTAFANGPAIWPC
ncbi:DUF192 domain-containing protein [Falsiphaeobacter marinintestinus]|uniref:DUF192 domain-containing protein n=1 Tax=Falsiphaeobacter marinintestinus TaxID=1492905 RepID=UPI0011B5B7A6|nr:DUF192 domain-containing protein [Phaeobacter marinintestinus]